MLTTVEAGIGGSLVDGSDVEEPPKLNPIKSPEDVDDWT
jgi:hypothetical protein